MGGREGVWAGADFVWSKNALVQRRIQMIHVLLHYLLGFASIFPFKADRFEWIDALEMRGGVPIGYTAPLPNPALQSP